jgi:hypothetical protein
MAAPFPPAIGPVASRFSLTVSWPERQEGTPHLVRENRGAFCLRLVDLILQPCQVSWATGDDRYRDDFGFVVRMQFADG